MSNEKEIEQCLKISIVAANLFVSLAIVPVGTVYAMKPGVYDAESQVFVDKETGESVFLQATKDCECRPTSSSSRDDTTCGSIEVMRVDDGSSDSDSD